MSTYCYFECLNHEPPLRSENEFTQHVGDSHWHHAMELMDSRPVDADDSYWSSQFFSNEDQSNSYFDMQARSFLHQHPTCDIGIVTEYDMRLNRDGSRQ